MRLSREEISATEGMRKVFRGSVDVAVPIERMNALGDFEDALWRAIRAPHHLEHRVLERFDDGHRCISVVGVNGEVLEIPGEELHLSDVASYARQQWPMGSSLVHTEHQPRGKSTRIRITMWSTDWTRAYRRQLKPGVRALMIRLRGYYEDHAVIDPG